MTPATLRTIRKSLALTQGELATALGYERRAVTAWEYGERPVPALVAAVLLAGQDSPETLQRVLDWVERDGNDRPILEGHNGGPALD
jgi:DNA-binding transcriptional regulator YiaG